MENIKDLDEKINEFKDKGKCEVHTPETAMIMLSVLRKDCNEFYIHYGITTFGEFWYFSREMI